jgi:hypothetical protein
MLSFGDLQRKVSGAIRPVAYARRWAANWLNLLNAWMIGERMSKDNHQEYEIMGKGDLVMLRTHLETDREPYKRWQTYGEWRLLDAPWAQNVTEEKKDKERSKKQTNTQDDSAPQIMAVIATLSTITQIM